MPTQVDKIADSLNMVPIVEEKSKLPAKVEPTEVENDIEYSRENIIHLVERGRDALDGIMDLARQSQSPRAYEVVAQVIKVVGETNRDLIDLQKKAKDLFDEKSPKTVNNNLFVGNTSELTKLLGGNARDTLKGKTHAGATIPAGSDD